MGLRIQISLLFAFLAFGYPVAAFTKERITADVVLRIAQENKVKSVDELLPLLPAELRKNFSLVRETRNEAQFASSELPRTILFSDDGGFQLTFAGSNDVQGGNLVEMITQNPDGKYSFSTIAFLNNEPKFHGSPKSCNRCHGAEPRPIWDGYPKWPGVYGSDHFRMRLEDRNNPAYQQDHEKFQALSQELKDLNKFYKEQANVGRYKNLLSLEKAAYADLANLNTHLSETLMKASNRNLVAALLEQEGVEKYLPWLLRTLENKNRDSFSLMGEEFFEGFPGSNAQDTYLEFYNLNRTRTREMSLHAADVRTRLSKSNPEYYKDLNPQEKLHFGTVDQDAFSALELVARRLGISPNFFQPGIQGSIRQVGGLAQAHYDLYDTFVEELMARDPKFAKLVDLTSASNNNRRYRISLDGYAYLSKAGFKVPSAPLQFKDIKNHFPIVDLPLAQKCFELFKKFEQ